MMRTKNGWTLFFALLTLGSLSLASGLPEEQASVARQWNERLLDAIRLDIPKPTVHSRNLLHVSIAMWDAWAIYEPTANGVLVTDKILLADPISARNEAISYAAYRVLRHRYRFGPGEMPSQESFDALMDALGYDRSFSSIDGDSPAAVGNRIGQAVIDFGLSDGANEGPLLDYADDTGYLPRNRSLVFELPGAGMFEPNYWQPLAFEHFIFQNGIVVGAAVQDFLGPNWGKVATFGLDPEDQAFPWVYLDPGPPPMLGGVGDEDFKANAVEVISLQSYLDPGDGVLMDISPGAIHNNPLGTHDGIGRPLNPYTGEPYLPNIVRRGDYGRVIAEFWADGPDSETPPGHWNTLLNYVTDHPLFERRLHGEGEILDLLEWNVKTYLALNGAVHDSAVAAWGAKGYYDYSRPISHIRHMAEQGQSSDPMGPSYHPDGLLLVDGLIEVITEASTLPGERHEALLGFEGEIAIRAWQGIPDNPATEYGGVGWIRALEWLPYQRDTFVTPPFAGYVSGHSTFSRAAAEVMAGLTGDVFFPGGMGTFTAHQNEYLEFEDGPSETVQLQWATYYDAADEAGISRLWGGIHPIADDLPGRVMGSVIGIRAWARAQEYYGDGELTLCHIPRGNPDNRHSIRISPSAIPAHLRHGDSFGACEPSGAVQFGISARSTGRRGNLGRGHLLGRLGLETDLQIRLDIVSELIRQPDPALNRLLINHLREIATLAQARGLTTLVDRSRRLEETLE